MRRGGALLSYFFPQCGHCCVQLGSRSASRPGTGTDDEIRRGELVLVQSKRLPDDPPDPIALNRTAGRPDCHGEPDARLVQGVTVHSHSEESIAETPATRVNGVEVRLAEHAPFHWERQPFTDRAGADQVRAIVME